MYQKRVGRRDQTVERRVIALARLLFMVIQAASQPPTSSSVTAVE